MEDGIRVAACLKVKPGTQQAMETAMLACASTSLAEEGCLLYAGHYDQSDEDRLVFVEQWTSQAVLDEHRTTPHFQAFAAAPGDLVDRASEIIVLHEIR